MAKDLKPNVIGLGREVTPTDVKGTGYYASSAVNLFDGIIDTNNPMSNAYYWSSAIDHNLYYVEFTISSEVNVWRCPHPTYLDSGLQANALKIYKKENDVFVDISSQYNQVVTTLGSNEWEKTISNLKPGTYRFLIPLSYSGTVSRIDGEWYLEKCTKSTYLIKKDDMYYNIEDTTFDITKDVYTSIDKTYGSLKNLIPLTQYKKSIIKNIDNVILNGINMFEIPFSDNVQSVNLLDSNIGYTLDPNNANQYVAFTDGNSTATKTVATLYYSTVRTVKPLDKNKKYYWEVQVNHIDNGSVLIGVTNKEEAHTNGSNAYGFVYSRDYRCNASKWISGLSYGKEYTDGDRIGVACDLVNNTVSFYKNGEYLGVAYSDLEELTEVYPCGVVCHDNDSLSFIFNSEHYKYPIPEGFSALPYVKYILMKDNVYYTVSTDGIIQLPDQNLTVENILNNGVDNIGDIDISGYKLLVYNGVEKDSIECKFTFKKDFQPIEKFGGNFEIYKNE